MGKTELEQLVGKRLKSQQVRRADWDGYWPEVNDDGIIQNDRAEIYS